MGKLVDISGKKFGRLTCLEMAGRKNGHVQWRFKCDCGKEIITRGLDVRRGKSTSCGCQRNENLIKISKGVSPKDRKKLKKKD